MNFCVREKCFPQYERYAFGVWLFQAALPGACLKGGLAELKVRGVMARLRALEGWYEFDTKILKYWLLVLTQVNLQQKYLMVGAV